MKLFDESENLRDSRRGVRVPLPAAAVDVAAAGNRPAVSVGVALFPRAGGVGRSGYVRCEEHR